MDKLTKPNSYDYLSTQEFARAIEDWAQGVFRGYSRRSFAKWAKIASPNFMSLVIDGKRPLRGRWLEGFCKAAQLPEEQIKYLRILSQFENVKNPRKRNELLEKIHQTLSELNTKSLASDQLEVLTHPLAWTVLQMLDLKGQTSSPIWFKQRLRFPASTGLVTEALGLLKRLGLTQVINGKIRPAQKVIESPDQVQKSTNVLFHKNVLSEAASMLDLVAPQERAFGSFTATVQAEKIEVLKQEINRFGQYLLTTYASSDVVDGEVVRLNIQLYPLTSKGEKSNA